MSAAVPIAAEAMPALGVAEAAVAIAAAFADPSPVALLGCI